MSSYFRYDPINDIYHEGIPTNDTLLYGSDIREVHGSDIHLRCTLIMRSLHSVVGIDRRIIQLMLVIMLFSKGLSSMINFQEPQLNNRRQILQAQNDYAKQLWLFLEQCYGSTQASLIFSTLINNCLLIQTLFRDIQQNINEKLAPCQVSCQMPTFMHLS